MVNLETWIRLAGIGQLALLAVAASVPRVLDWKGEMRKLPPFLGQLFWVYGGFIFLTILGAGLLCAFLPAELASGAPLARAVCGFLAFWWTARLAIQLLVFDARPYLKTAILKVGYHSLTVLFVYLAVVFAAAAFGRRTPS